MNEFAAHLTVLGVSFLAATIIPGSSEVVLVAMVLESPAELMTFLLQRSETPRAVPSIGCSAGGSRNLPGGAGFRPL